MSSHDDEYFDDYDYYQNTGELSEYFEEEDEEEQAIEDQPQNLNTMPNIKLKELNKLTEVHDAGATSFGIELKSFVFRNIDDNLYLYLEVATIPGKRCKKDDLSVNVVLYDTEGDILDTNSEYLEGSSFKGFEVIRVSIYNVAPSDISRAVIYFG